MRVRPHELANVCALFPSLRAGRIGRDDFENYVQKTLSIDSFASPRRLITECIDAGLVSLESGQYSLTQRGKELAKRHNDVASVLSPAAKEFLLKNVYLNPVLIKGHCRDLLFLLRVDPALGTFVYDRSDDEPYEVVSSLQLLSTVGFLEVSSDVAIVRTEYLGLANELLLSARTGIPNAVGQIESELSEVGLFAEEKTVEDEKNRLARSGYAELASLVHRISHVDRTAGYDVVSCAGVGITPEQRIFIEVKGTRSSRIGFVWTRNEISVAGKTRKSYWLYVYRNVDLTARSADGPLRINDPVRTLGRLGYVQEPLDVYVTKPSAPRIE